MTEELADKVLIELESTDEVVKNIDELLSRLEITPSTSPLLISRIGDLMGELSKKLEKNKKCNNEYTQWLKSTFSKGVEFLETVCLRSGSKDQRVAAFRGLLQLIPLYNDAFHTKPMFPIAEYSTIIRILMSSDGDIAPLLPHLKDLMTYEDMHRNIWKAIDIATKMDRLPVVTELRRILQVMAIVEPFKDSEAPKLYYSRVKVGVLNPKEMDKCVRRIWERLSLVKMESDVKQLLLLALLEKMMSRMDKPIFLTDYFMASLEHGGAISVLSLQGIFDLIQKYNMNYPDVYGKLYSMFTPELFQTSFKSRFYYLSDLFMSSTMLPEALVAGFAKRLARLALVAPPPDIIILMAFITNLLVRHPNLKVLLSRPGAANADADPYLAEEESPSESRAIESCLWEIRLLQDHVLPTVANAALWINNELPTIEKDMSALLENKTQLIFEKEMKIKAQEPPLSFERPTPSFLNKPTVRLAFSAWE
ncbi:hypothetical protein GE061_012664 [Apolygus lucorum]|uniref:CCAAT-binding factor domain-containing protein n=1 Tax=Apolygus lucorum TaxID=248454 RepID=A0A6A4JQA1_APOLU|nr:hypothetical protein GE061_012664 [Apolygus lucorum]